MADGGSDRRVLLRRVLGVGALGLAASACRPVVQAPRVGLGGGPRLEPDALVAADGARLPLMTWPAHGADGAPVEPWAVIVGLHGMNDYAAAFTLPGPYWAARGVTTYAYDQRGFGRAPGRGVWAGEALMAEDLKTCCALVRARHPRAILAVAGESMGGAVAVCAFASDAPPDADRLILAAPAVWGWRDQGIANGAALWTAAHIVPAARISAPGWLARRIRASDNIAELRRMGLDRQMIFDTRIDTVYGLVDLMQQAQDQIGAVRVPMLFQYGAHDELIPRPAARHALARLRPPARSAYYASGWHLLLRDLGRRTVLDDDLAFIRDPAGPLPSGAPTAPRRGRPKDSGQAPLASRASRASRAVA
jgi:acylglycerol lipase